MVTKMRLESGVVLMSCGSLSLSIWASLKGRMARLLALVFALFLTMLMLPSQALAQSDPVDWLVSISDGDFDLQPANTIIEYDVVVTNNGTDLAPNG